MMEDVGNPAVPSRTRAGSLSYCIDSIDGCLTDAGGTRRGIMDDAVFELTMARIAAHVASFHTAGSVNMSFGSGDHLLLGVEHLSGLHRLGSAAMAATKVQDRRTSAVRFTTSFAGRPASVLATLRETRLRIAGRVPLIPVVVADAAYLRSLKTGSRMRDIVAVAVELFGRVELSVSLSSDLLETIAPAELVAYAARAGFGRISLRWPMTGGKGREDGSATDMAAWLKAFDAAARRKGMETDAYASGIARASSSVMMKDGKPDLAATVEESVSAGLGTALSIDYMGEVSPAFDGIGTMAHGGRSGMPPLGNVRDSSMADLLAGGRKAILNAIVGIHARGACSTCRHAAVCAGTGFHIATRIARHGGDGATEDGCPHVARVLMDAVVGSTGAVPDTREQGLLWSEPVPAKGRRRAKAVAAPGTFGQHG